MTHRIYYCPNCADHYTGKQHCPECGTEAHLA